MSGKTFIGFLIIASVLLAACKTEAYELTGTWDGGDWGEITFTGLEGIYSSTYGSRIGKINVIKSGKGSYTGTWGEGKPRYGTLTFSFESKNIIIGRWEADPASTISAQAGGPIRWERLP